MQNIGEEICGEYLNHIIGCDFISYNIINPDTQGEIDVIGIELSKSKKNIFICEVATHTGGLCYNKNGSPEDYARFYKKFIKNIAYAKKYFPDYNIIPMIWSPVVRNSKVGSKYNTYNELLRLKDKIADEFNKLELQLIINEKYEDYISKLKVFASNQSSAFSSPVMRLYQIEQNLYKHNISLEKRGLI